MCACGVECGGTEISRVVGLLEFEMRITQVLPSFASKVIQTEVLIEVLNTDRWIRTRSFPLKLMIARRKLRRPLLIIEDIIEVPG